MIISGRFLAELTKEVLSDLEASKYQVWIFDWFGLYLVLLYLFIPQVIQEYIF